MNRLMIAAAFLFLVAVASPRAATITIINLDGAGEGFNDPTPATPVGGNPGTTIGQQRLNVFQEAANIWGGLLPSAVEIRQPERVCRGEGGRRHRAPCSVRRGR